MKIVFLVNEFPSVTETFILSQIHGLLDRNHEVTIFAKKGLDNWDRVANPQSCDLRDRTIYPSMPKNTIRRGMRALKHVLKYITKYSLPILKSLNVVKYLINSSGVDKNIRGLVSWFGCVMSYFRF